MFAQIGDDTAESTGLFCRKLCWTGPSNILRELPCIATDSVFGAIACPPRLLKFKPSAHHSLHLIHYAPDRLCVWYPSRERLNSLRCKKTFVEGNSYVYERHFGKHERNYGHWLRLSMDHGIFAIAQVMMWFLEAAAEQKRDATPSRLISWLTFDLLRELKAFLESLMLQFSRQVHPPIGDIMILVQTAYKDCGDFKTEEQVRDFVVAQLGEWNGRRPPDRYTSWT